MVDFGAVIQTLIDVGFYTFVLPFVLTFVVIYAVLEKAKIFHTEGANHIKNVNAIISFIFGFFVVSSVQAISYIQSFIIYSVVIVMFFLALIVVLGMVLGEDFIQVFKENGKVKKGAIIGVFIIITIIILVGSGFFFKENVSDFLDYLPEDIWTYVFIFAIIGVLWWIVKNDTDGDKKTEEKNKS